MEAESENFVVRYRNYLRHNPEGYWFKNKIYGWGWVPAVWQGWATLGVFVVEFAVMITSFTRISSPTDTETLWFMARVFAWVAALISVCYLTGEPPKWQWGIPDDSYKRSD